MRLRPGRVGLLPWLAGGLAVPVASASLVAERITPDNVQERQIGGPDAVGGIGDWYLANDRIEVIVDDPSRRYATLNYGGTIVDAGLRGREGDDQFARLFPLVNLDQRLQLNYDQLEVEVDPAGGFARLVVSSRQGMSAIPRGGWLWRRLDPLVPETEQIEQVFAETRYEVRPGEPFVRIITTLRNQGARPAPIFSYGDVWMRGGRSMRSFVGNTSDASHSPGFQHRSFDREAILESSGAMAAYSFVAMSGLPPWPAVTYAVVAPERLASGRLLFGVTGEHVTLVNVFLGDPGWRELGLLRLLGASRDELAAGESWSYERRLLVTGEAGVASATDRIFPWLGVADGSSGVEGRFEPGGVRGVVHVATREGFPVTQITTGPDGRYRAVLPPGDYQLTLRAEQRGPRQIDVSVPAGRFARVPAQAFPEPGALLFDPAFTDGGPGRVVVSGREGTPSPVFAPELLDFRIDGEPVGSGTETDALLFAGSQADPRRVALAPGRYRLIATRGPEFDAAQLDVEVPGPGAEVTVPAFDLPHVVPMAGWWSGDFHVHAQASDDSGISNEERLRGYVAEFVDVMVTTDHDHLGHFETALDALGVRDRIRVVQGVEVTSSTPSTAAPWTIGHHNAWPLSYRPTAHRRGAPPSQGLSVGELYSLLRHDYGAQVVQQNHPLGDEPGVHDRNFWSHLGSVGEGYEPDRPIDAAPNRALLVPASGDGTRAIDFDAVEVMNGESFSQYRKVREAWYSLLAQGFRRTATGNSDTHGPDEEAGYPRNYVHAEGDFELEAFNAAIREGRLFATTGPLITRFRAGGGGLGESVTARDGRIQVEIAVAAAPWVPVDEVRLLANGEVVRSWTQLADPAEVVRLDTSAELSLARDAFLTVEAGAPLDVDPARWRAERAGLYGVLAPGFVSQAISNPIYVDADGDGEFRAPGLGRQPGSDAATRQLLVVALGVLVLALVWWRLRVRVGLAPAPRPPRSLPGDPRAARRSGRRSRARRRRRAPRQP